MKMIRIETRVTTNGETIKTVENVHYENLAETIASDEIVAVTINTMDDIDSVSDWIDYNDDEETLIDIFPDLHSASVYVCSKLGGGRVIDRSHGRYCYNHSFVDGSIDDPNENDQTVIEWHIYDVEDPNDRKANEPCTVGELKEFLASFDDTDRIAYEDVDEEGDVIDLNQLTLDVFEGVTVFDGKIGREIRFCRGN